jgi:hypothetical protein
MTIQRVPDVFKATITAHSGARARTRANFDLTAFAVGPESKASGIRLAAIDRDFRRD